MEDDVPEAEKMRRFRALEALQAKIGAEINRKLLGRSVDVLVEKRQRGRWMGRTRTNKLVFFESPHDLRGRLVQVHIEHTGPWSMRGTLLDSHLRAL